MSVLHLLPTDSAGGSMGQALRDTGREDHVLAMPDDLSCGPITAGDLAERVEWWGQFYDPAEVEARLSAFWVKLDATSDRIVVWFSRNAAGELAFFHACAEYLDDRPWFAMDVTGRTLTDRVSHMQPEALMSLLGQEQPLPPQERREAVEHWRRLRSESAPFRVAPDGELVSAPIDYFDARLVAHARAVPRAVLSLVGEAMGEFDGQVGNVMLQERVAALVASGSLLTNDDPADIRSARVYRPT
jgi:hypothetical protein